MAKNTSRKNVIRQDNNNHDPNTIGNGKNKKPYCQSFIFGRNMKDPNQEYSFWSMRYPHIYQTLQDFFHKYNTTHFTYTHITINRNLQCKRHTDGGNMGLSYIIAVGDFTGGQLLIEEDVSPAALPTSSSSSSNTTKYNTCTTTPNERIHDVHRTFVLFNGKEQPHETLPFTGERYTLVYYTSDIVPKTTAIGGSSSSSVATLHHHQQQHNNNNSSNSNSTIPSRSELENNTTTSTGSTASSTSLMTAKFNAIKKKLGRRR
jgi:hypothetical protein